MAICDWYGLLSPLWIDSITKLSRALREQSNSIAWPCVQFLTPSKCCKEFSSSDVSAKCIADKLDTCKKLLYWQLYCNYFNQTSFKNCSKSTATLNSASSVIFWIEHTISLSKSDDDFSVLVFFIIWKKINEGNALKSVRITSHLISQCKKLVQWCLGSTRTQSGKLP